MPFKYYNNKMKLDPISARKPKSQSKDLGKNRFHVNTYETRIALPEGGKNQVQWIKRRLRYFKKRQQKTSIKWRGYCWKTMTRI